MFDLILVAIFLFMIYLGWKRGFVKAFLRFFGFFISSFVAYLSYKPVSDWLMTTPLAEKIHLYVQNDIINGGQANTVVNLPFSGNLKMSLEKAINSGIQSAINSTTEVLTQFFISLISITLVFLIAFLAVKILEYGLSGLVKLPGLSLFNKVCGLIIGVVNGVICVYLTILLSSALAPFYPKLAEISQESIITNLIL